MVRAPGGQLITRVKTEAAAGKLIADVDRPFRPRTDAARLADLFQDYAPPNAADYHPGGAVVAEAVAALTAGVVDRLQHRAGEEPAEELDGSDQAGI